MDAQQRLLLEHSFEALAAAPGLASPERTAVFVGIGTVDYVTMSAHLGVGMYVASGANHSAHLVQQRPARQIASDRRTQTVVRVTRARSMLDSKYFRIRVS